jgi:arylsulfatase
MVSTSALLHGRTTSARDYLFAEYHPRRDDELYNQTIISKDWRLTLYPNRDGWGELFDLRTDPWEHRNLFEDKPDDAPVAEMRATLIQRMPPKPKIRNQVLGAY